MKFQSNIFADARGKLNGNVFTKNRFASVVRNKVSPVQPQSISQLNQRQNFGALSAGWRSLTQEQRSSWDAFATSVPRTNTFGQTYSPTGQNYYIGLNTNLLNAGQPTIQSPVVFVGFDNIDLSAATLTIDVSGNDMTLALGNIAGANEPPIGYTLLVRATLGVSQGRKFLKNYYRIITDLSHADDMNTNYWNDYVAAIGKPIVGQRIGLGFSLVNNVTGQQSLMTTIDAIVVNI